jgi:helix-turn-helix resolvase-like protein
VILVEDWAEIRRLHRAEGLSARAVARQLGISRNTVLRALASDRPPQYRRRVAQGSAVDAVEPAVRELLRQTPTMPVTVIAERIGWERGLTILRDRVRELRPAYLPVDPVSRTVYQPGELAQCDLWFPPVDIPLGYGQGGRPPVLVIVSGGAGAVVVARHPRCWARHQTLTDPGHAEAARLLRGEVWHQQAARAATARRALALAPDNLGVEVEQRELGSYDRMFTLIEGGAGTKEADT